MDREERLARQRAAGRRYVLAHPERVREYQRRYRAADPERAREQRRRTYLKYAEKRRAEAKQYHLDHPAQNREQSRRWAKANPEKVAATNQKCYLRRQNPCIDCGKVRHTVKARCRACDVRNRTGPSGPAWEGGTSTEKDGYRKIYVGPGEYYPEQRIVWKKANGPLVDGYIVHHINGNRLDNRLENLAAMTRSEHMKLHRAQASSVS